MGWPYFYALYSVVVACPLGECLPGCRAEGQGRPLGVLAVPHSYTAGQLGYLYAPSTVAT